MRFVQFRSAPALLSATFLALLVGCSSPSQQATTPPTTASDTAAKERDVAPPSAYNGHGQIQIPFGSTAPTEAQLRAQRQRQSTTQGLIPEGRAYLGTIPCDTAACNVQRVTLTLLPDGRWRRVSLPLDPAGQARTDTGCWTPEPAQQPLIHLLAAGVHAGNGRLATLRMQNPATLSVQALGAKTLTHRYTLNIQADTESINALQNDTSFYCPAR